MTQLSCAFWLNLEFLFVLQHYIDLNEPYLQVNTDNFKQGQTDYLSFMGPPDAIAPAIPDYVNSPVKSNLDGKFVGLFGF